MELLSEHQRIFLEKEHLQDVALKFVASSNDWNSDNNGAPTGNIITAFVEMCVEIFGGDGSVVSSVLIPARSPIENGLQMDRRMSSTNLMENGSMSPSSSPSSASVIVQKCVGKYRQVLRRHYDMKSVSLEKYLKQSDLNIAREAALSEATQFFLQIRNKAVDHEDPFLQQLKRQIAREYGWVEAVNQQKKSRFLQRICHELDKLFVEKVELRYGTLFSDEFSDAKLQFCDERRLRQMVEQLVNDTLEGFKEYLQFSCEECSVSSSNSHLSTCTNLKALEMQARDRLAQVKDVFVQRNRQTFQKAVTFLHSHLEDSAADCRVGIEKKLEADPFLTKQQINETLITAKKRKYIEEFSMRVLFSDDNAEFQRDFKKQLTAKLDTLLDNLLESAHVRKQKIMTQFSDRFLHDLHQLVHNLSKEHGIRPRHANKLNSNLMETARKSLEGILHEVHVKSTKWTCGPIPNLLDSSHNSNGQVRTGAFSVQLSYCGLRVGLLQNHIPHVLQYRKADNMVTSTIPLVAGITYGYPGEFVFGHEVEERRKLGCLRSSWNLAKMLHEKQHCRTSFKHDRIRLFDTEFTPTVEFLLACILKRCKKLCVDSVRSGGVGDDGRNIKAEIISVLEKCLISVPPRLLPFQRQQIKDAGQIAGFLDANLRIVEDTSCLAFQAEAKLGHNNNNNNEAASKMFRSPQDNDNSKSEDLLVISQNTDFQQRVKFDFVQYKVVSSTKMSMENYIDENIIMLNHFQQCKNCQPNSPGKISPAAAADSPSLSHCETMKHLKGQETSLDCFCMSLLREALAHPKNSKVTRIILNCELPQWQTVLDSTLPHCLPSMAVKMGGVKYCGEYSVLQGLIQMGSRGVLWDKWITNNLHTRSCSIWVKDRNGLVTGNLGGYKFNDRQTTSSKLEGRLICTDYQVCVNFGLNDVGPAKEDDDWGCLTISKEIPRNQTFCPKFTQTEEGVFRPPKVDVCQIRQDQQLAYLYTLEVDEDYKWVTGNMSKAKLKEFTANVNELLKKSRNNNSTKQATSSRRMSAAHTSYTPTSPSAIRTELSINASVASKTSTATATSYRTGESGKRAALSTSCNVAEKKVCM